MRKQYWVVPSGAYWQVKHENRVLSNYYDKDTAVRAGRQVARANPPCQLKVMRANGTIEDEPTYELDRFPPRG